MLIINQKKEDILSSFFRKIDLLINPNVDSKCLEHFFFKDTNGGFF
jgi:hypothetical protein